MPSVFIRKQYIAGSSNGRTSAFEAEYFGSNPSPAAVMKVFLLKTELDRTLALDKASLVIEGLQGNIHTASISPGLADSDLIICDLENISEGFSNALKQQHHNFSKRINNGAVLLCFAGRPISRNYEWLKDMKIDLIPESLVAKDINFSTNLPFADFFKKNEKNFSHHAIFNRTIGGTFHELAKNKSGDLVAVYSKIGNGHVFILPRPKDFNDFIKSFIDEVLPKLEVGFLLLDGSVEPIPKEIEVLTVTGQEAIISKIKIETEKIQKANEKKTDLENQLLNLERWKDLLWQTGTPLENIVKRFFEEFFDLKLTKTDVDLIGEYKNKELFIEVKGNTGTINHSKDFRQIHERKFYNAKDPQNTIALLIGNPFRLLPLDQRPPEHDSLFAKTSIPIAETSGIGLIHTKILYDIVNDILSNLKVNKKDILDELMNSVGIYKYKK